MKVTTFILAKNEENTIDRAVRSVRNISTKTFVIDDNSTDATALRATGAGATVLKHNLGGDFARQRNWGLEKAITDWVLFVDADEEVSEELANEILRIDEARFKESSAFSIPRYDYWQGVELTVGELHTASSTGFARLVKRGTGRWEGNVHEVWKSQHGRVEQIRNHMKHYPHPTVAEFIADINHYSTLRAKELFQAKVPVSIFQIWAYPLGKFLMSYFVLMGFMHGAPGFIYSFMMSFHSFLVRSKLYQYYNVEPPAA